VQVSHLLNWGDGSDLKSADGQATVNGQSVSGTDATIDVPSGVPVNVSIDGLTNPSCFYLDRWAAIDAAGNEMVQPGSSGQVVANDLTSDGPDLYLIGLYELDPNCSIA